VILSSNPTTWRLCERSISLPEPGFAFARPSSGTTDSRPILEKWQKIVNLMAEMLDVPAGLINKRLMTQFRDIVEILWRLSIRKRNAERS
jgi:hypothetical protein